MERKEHTRYVVRALVHIMWTDKGILHRGQVFARAINSKGIFICSDSESPAKGEVEVEVSFPSLGEADANLRMTAQSLIIRVEPPPSPRNRTDLQF